MCLLMWNSRWPSMQYDPMLLHWLNQAVVGPLKRFGILSICKMTTLHIRPFRTFFLGHMRLNFYYSMDNHWMALFQCWKVNFNDLSFLWRSYLPNNWNWFENSSFDQLSFIIIIKEKTIITPVKLFIIINTTTTS
jgi:hypothetical protein